MSEIDDVVMGTVPKPDSAHSRDDMLRGIVRRVRDVAEGDALVVKLTNSQRSRLYHVAKQEGLPIATTAYKDQTGTWLVYRKD